ncbi:MAG: hypothetical protein HY360_23675 [Verrucomicrobia bacterium]|nr:hypothetical protein [Verrucomicrobiota bacterium]
MKTTIEIAEPVFRRAKVHSAGHGITLKQFITEAVEEKLRSSSAASGSVERPWMKGFGAFGKTAAMRAETRRIQKLIDEEFEQIETEDRQ